MALSPVDRDVKYMKENWGTTQLITDYVVDEKKVLQEVMYDPEVKAKKVVDLFETSDEDLSYGVEPTYKVQKNQRVLCD